MILSFLVIKPFLTAILVSLVLAYIFHPIYRILNKKIKNKNIAAFIVTILIVLLIIAPSFFILNTVSREAYFLYLNSKQTLFTGDVFSSGCSGEITSLKCTITDYFKGLFSDPQTKFYIDDTIKKATEFFVGSISGFLFSIPARVLNFFIILFVTFFFFRDGDLLVKKIEKLLPLKEGHKKRVFARFNNVAFAVIYGSILVAIIQGSLGGIGFFAVGIKSPLVWAVIMMMFALVPYVGSTVIWLPAALILVISGYVESDSFIMLKGILLIVYGTFIIGLADNFLKPKIIGDRANVHPVLVLLGVLGGLKFFGFIGILVGPVLLALLISFVEVYEEEKYF